MQLLFLSFLLLSSLVFAQAQPENVNTTVSKADLELMVGKWSGVMLTFEADGDSVQSSTDIEWIVTESDSGFELTETDWDEGGESQTVTEHVSVAKGGRRMTMDGAGWIVWAKHQTANGRTIIIQRPGQEGNRSAQFTNILYLSFPDSARQDSLVLTKKALYENAGRETLKSQFRLGRIKE